MKALVYAPTPLGWAAAKLLRPLWPGSQLAPLAGLSLRELPAPALPGPDWVLCRTRLSGVCGSDLGILAQRQPADSILQSFSTLPMVLGHENVSTVEQVGPAVDGSWVGKRVCVEPALTCIVRGIDPPCPNCRQGRWGSCQNFSAHGQGSAKLPPGSCLGYCGPAGGTWAEFFPAHVSQLIEPPSGIPDRQALLTDPLACSLHAVLKVDLHRAERVFVYGGGILGLGIVWALRAIGWTGKIDIAARHPQQWQWATRLGADEVLSLPAEKAKRYELIAGRVGGRVSRARFGNYMLSGGYDVAFECVGSAQTIEEALKWTAEGGQVVMIGTGSGRGADMTPIWFTELTVYGASGRAEETYCVAGVSPAESAGETPATPAIRMHTYKLVHKLMLEGDLDLSSLLTHTYPLEQYKAALLAAMGKSRSGAIKVGFEFGSR